MRMLQNGTSGYAFGKPDNSTESAVANREYEVPSEPNVYERNTKSIELEPNQPESTRRQRKREEHLESKMRRKTKYIKRLHKENEHLAGELQCRDEQMAELNAKIEDMSRELQILQTDIEVRDAEVRKAQELAFHQMNGGNWAPLEDRLVRSELKTLEGAIRTWTKTYLTTQAFSLESLLPEDMSQIQRLLCPAICSRNEDLPTTIRRWPVGDKWPILLVHAIISKYIFQHIFDEPFYFLNDNLAEDPKGDDPRRSNQTAGDRLGELYDVLRQVDERDAHMWRSQTLRLLNTPSDKTNVKQNCEELARSIHGELAGSILHGPVRRFCREVSNEEHEQRSRDLLDLFDHAGKLAMSLWTQRTFMCSIDGRELKKFHVDSSIEVAHRLQKLDDDDHRLDGHKILAVIQPALIALGNENGENYGEHKVWSKAIVLVAEE